ncbi:hypothetical protein D3C80_1985930 [compost metagenome]
MLGQNFSAEANSLLRSNTSVSPNLKRKLVIVRYLTNASIFHAVINTSNWRVYRINGNYPNRLFVLLVAVRLHVTTSPISKNPHMEPRAGGQGCDVKIRA